MTQTAGEPLLDITTLIERPFIRIDGTVYELRSPGELSVFDSLRFGRWGKKIDELQAAAADDGDAELNDLVAKLAQAILVEVPDAVFAGLTGAQRWAIIDLFTGLLLREKLKVAGAINAATGPVPAWMENLTGGSSFPGSSGSTAAPRATGFIARLRQWFGRI